MSDVEILQTIAEALGKIKLHICYDGITDDVAEVELDTSEAYEYIQNKITVLLEGTTK